MGFFLGYIFLNPQGLAYGFLWRTRHYPMIQKFFRRSSDKTTFLKFKISNNFQKNVDETHSKQPRGHGKIHASLWILKIS